jgi:hypothetical protein
MRPRGLAASWKRATNTYWYEPHPPTRMAERQQAIKDQFDKEANMNINYDGHSYIFDLEEIDISQATVIKRKFGLTLLTLESGLREGDPDALRAMYWIMLTQDGQRVNIDNVNFKIVKFANAIQQANEEEIARDDEKAKAEGKTPKETS